MVAQQLDALPQGVLQLFGYAIGMLVGILLQAIQQTQPLRIQQGFPVQQHRNGL